MNELEPYYFYFELPIYSPIKIDSGNDNSLWDLLAFNGTIDAYHPGLKENTTFSIQSCIRINYQSFDDIGGMNYSILKCVRTILLSTLP